MSRINKFANSESYDGNNSTNHTLQFQCPISFCPKSQIKFETWTQPEQSKLCDRQNFAGQSNNGPGKKSFKQNRKNSNSTSTIYVNISIYIYIQLYIYIYISIYIFIFSKATCNCSRVLYFWVSSYMCLRCLPLWGLV